MDVRKILFPVDFSVCTAAALPEVALLARTFGAEVEVLHIWQPPPDLSPVPMPGALASAMHEQIEADAVASELRERGVKATRGRVEVGDTAGQILDRAARGGFDLTVIGTHGRTGVGRLVLGSVAEAVVRRARGPVITVRRTLADRAPALRRILVAVDFSEGARAALADAADLAERFGAQVTLLHVWQSPRHKGEPAGQEAQRIAAADLRAFAATVNRPTLAVETRLELGVAAEVIAKLSSEYDLLAMGTHGRTGLAHVMLGSVAEQVVRSAGCPVLVVRRAEEEK